ncbi:helix-turn-helix transcriptional regulator [Pseudomonas tohonis]|uniref:HTH-type transcriptional regulator VqsM n=1 Tax=Pseudomonas tohonis TaxID=2725477 RepID=A0ABQ4W6Y5_9PSED|nr:AraC family transcriptional regulator [Pseudomonas tohonis]GJN55237.1 HTH-type transcriptional regulator VqsM [Pseudomonas tohonis]
MQSSLLTFDFEWRPLQNYLRDSRRAAPDLLPTGAGQLPSHALYDWIVQDSEQVSDGLRLGEYYRASDYGMAGLALMSAETLADALRVIRAYVLLFNPDISDIRVEHSPQGDTRIAVNLNARPGWSEQQRQFHANVLASASYHLFNQLIGRDMTGLGLLLPAGLGDTQAYEAYFHMPVRSQGSDIVFHLPVGMLDSLIPTANPAVFQTALAQASEDFNKLLEREMGGVRQRVIALLASLPEHYPDICQIAQHLKITERTLRRRLTAEGSSYRQILDAARYERAKRILERTQMSTEQLSELLGYSDASSFRQAFRRWTGMTLNEYRRSRPEHRPRA